jgi:hypothetical protein
VNQLHGPQLIRRPVAHEVDRTHAAASEFPEYDVSVGRGYGIDVLVQSHLSVAECLN